MKLCKKLLINDESLYKSYKLVVIPIKVYMIFISSASQMAKNRFTPLKPAVSIHFCTAQTCNAAFNILLSSSKPKPGDL